MNVIDTVGCGDSFVAAIAFGFIHNLPTVNTLAIANAVGAATAMGCGAGRNVANLEQVIELMRASNLNEDATFWNELLDDNLDAQQITFLSKTAINGSNNQLHRVALQKVVSESLCKLKSARIKGIVPSWCERMNSRFSLEICFGRKSRSTLMNLRNQHGIM